MNVVDFLRSYQTHPASFRVVAPLIADFIEVMNKDGELLSWTVALIGTADGAPAEIGGVPIGMVGRRRAGEHETRYAIKTLISPWDQGIDLSEAQWRAALARSVETWRGDAERNEGRQEPTEPGGSAIRHILGFGDQKTGLAAQRDRGLLMLYLLDPDKSGEPVLSGRPPVLAWAISFPGSASKRTVSNADYMANAVLWGNINDDMD